jgi:hypothetical protein
MTRNKFVRALKWVRYSGASVIVTLNPLHWCWAPVAQHEPNTEWSKAHERTYRVSWLFLTVRIWIDNGDW